MGILAWLITGSIAGYLTARFLPTGTPGGSGTVPGLLGGALGGFLVDLVVRGDGVIQLLPPTLIGAVVGAVVLAAAWVLSSGRPVDRRAH